MALVWWALRIIVGVGIIGLSLVLLTSMALSKAEQGPYDVER